MAPFPLPVEYMAAAIAFFVQPVNYRMACHHLAGVSCSDHIILGVDAPVSSSQLFAFVLQISGGGTEHLESADRVIRSRLRRGEITKIDIPEVVTQGATDNV